MEKPWDPLANIPDLHGKIVVVTGASVGIGFEIVRLLASRGAKVFPTTRSETSARNAQEKLRATSPGINVESIEWLQLDLADLKSIAAFSDKLKRQTTKIDILINNAGVGTVSTELVAGRWEQHMAVNVAGPFYLVDQILPLLENASMEKNADVRIVNISSIAPATFLPVDFEFSFDSSTLLTNPVPSYPKSWRFLGRFIFGFDMIRYSISKVGVALFTQELQHKLDTRELPILSLSVHPGEVATEGVMKSNNALIKTVARLSFLSSEQGAANPIFAAVARDVRLNSERYKGKFIVPIGKVVSLHPVVGEQNQAHGLWVNTAKELNKELWTEGLPILQEW